MTTKPANWRTVPSKTLPTPRRGHLLLYAKERKQFMLFGGVNPDPGAGNLRQLWTATENDWQSREFNAAPPGLSFMAAAQDETRNSTVVFGGLDGPAYSQATWLYDGAAWTQAAPASAPPARAYACMAYDPKHGNMALFGGASNAGTFSDALNDTWLWDGENWKGQSPAQSPTPRVGAGMLYHPGLAGVILFGGGNSFEFNNDLWLWDGANWKEIHSKHAPPGRIHFGMAYDAKHQQVVLFGGYSADGNLNDTWLWDGDDWSQLATPNSPSLAAGIYPALAYD
ncbi:MAG: kelch repeat-containing protein, partial [Anaerolineales bacterium]